jgi:hypothetical protein
LRASLEQDNVLTNNTASMNLYVGDATVQRNTVADNNIGFEQASSDVRAAAA